MSITKLHTPLTKITLALFTAASSLVLSSCQDEDYGFTTKEIRDSVYDRNFIAKYGEIDPNQTWDLSSYASLSGATTRATVNPDLLTQSCDFDSNDTWFSSYVKRENSWYYVDPTLVKNFTDKLPEGQDNSSMGGPFTLTSNGTFYIIPLFQGASGIESDLHMVVTTSTGTYDKCIWDKSSFIQKQVSGSFDWNGLTQKMDYWADYGGKGENGDYKGSTLYAKGVRSMPIRCDIPKDATVEFYLHITRGHMNYRSSWGNEYDRWSANKREEGTDWNYDEPNLAFTGVKQWSSNSHGTVSKMIALSSNQFAVDDETKKKYGSNVMLIGCEDALYGKEDAVVWSDKSNSLTYKYSDTYTRGKDNATQPIQSIKDDKTLYWEGDNDMNDMIFMIVSNALPDVKRTDEIRKRYLIEDLGSVVDWDFNDVVVDLVQTTKVEDGVTTKTQKAILKHLCGTTPFDLYIGEEGNPSNSVKLDFTTTTTVKDYEGKSQRLSIPVNGHIPGIQMDRDAELNIEYTLSNNSWNPDNNNIWVRVYQDKNYADRKDPAGGENYGGTVNPDYNKDVINGEINSSFNYQVFVDVAFPRQGKVPRIIAVDSDFKWTAEDVNIQPTLWTNVTITATPNNADWGTVSGAGTYRVGKEVVLTAIAKTSEYEFVQWSDDNKERTRSFTAAEAKELTATFQHIQTIVSTNPPNEKDENGVMKQYAGVSAGTSAEISKLIDAGYNTVTILAEGATAGSEFRIVDATWNDLLASDPLTYSMTYNATTTNGVTSVTYILSEDQLKAIKNAGGIVMQKFSNDALNITGVNWSKTQDYYTIDLKVNVDGSIDQAAHNQGQKCQVTTDDRKTWNKCAAFGQASYPAGQQVTLKAVPDANHYFSHWENTKGSLNTVKNPSITIEASSNLVAYFKSKPTLTLALDDLDKDDFDLYINGESATSAKLIPGEKVKVKAKKKTNKNNADYKFMWSGVSGLEDTNDDVETAEFEMPETDCTLNCTVLYQTTPQVRFNNTAIYDGKCGSITLEWNGRKSTNTQDIYVPLGAQVKATFNAKLGYKLNKWLYSNNTTTIEYTYTRSNTEEDKKHIYMPQAEVVAEQSTQVFEGSKELNYEYHSRDIDNQFLENNGAFSILSSTKRKITIVFDRAPQGTIAVRLNDWGNNAIKTGLSLANTYVQFELTEEQVNTLQNSSSPKILIQHSSTSFDYGKNDGSNWGTALKITKIYFENVN